jgi:hypothetical protein
MSLSTILSTLNKPPLVLGTGLGIAFGGLPVLAANVGSLSLPLLQALNVLSFACNVTAVSVPGRLDGQQDERMRKGSINPSNTKGQEETTPLTSKARSDEKASDEADAAAANLRLRSLVLPAGWAFSIWGVIYLGETTLCVAQFVNPDLQTVLPQVTAPFVAANLVQSLWCASFRPSYNDGWHKYVSVAVSTRVVGSLFGVYFII